MSDQPSKEMMEAAAARIHHDMGCTITAARICAQHALAAALASRSPAPVHEYDRDLGKISDKDREYAVEIMDEIANHTSSLEDVAQWLRKVRYEAVIADRKMRAAPAPLAKWHIVFGKLTSLAAFYRNDRKQGGSAEAIATIDAAYKALDEMEAALSAAPADRAEIVTWHDIRSAPKDGTKILIFVSSDDDGECHKVAYWSDLAARPGWFYRGGWIAEDEPDAWCRLDTPLSRSLASEPRQKEEGE